MLIRKIKLILGILMITLFLSPIIRGEDMEAKIDQWFEAFDGPDVPGAGVMVIREGKIGFKKSYGLADLEKKIPADEYTNYRLASVSKQFTAMTIMILKEKGALRYEDSLKQYFPDFPEIGNRITIRHLLNHTSGVIDYEDIIPEDRTEQLKDRDVLELLKGQQGTYFTPGTEYRYSNTGYALLTLIVEKLSGQPYSSFLKENIFLPLGMNDSVAYEKGISTVPHRALGYRETEQGFVENDQSRTSAVLGDGGVYTSLMDYFKWDQALYREKLVSWETLHEAFTSALLPDGTPTGYGFGWRIEERPEYRLIYHNGLTCGFNNAVSRIPEKHLSVAIFTNRAETKARQIASEMVDWLLKKEGRDR